MPVRHLLAFLVAGALALAGCSSIVAGRPEAGQRNVDPGYFFAGQLPRYGQAVSAGDIAVLAYLRALRRVDVCGLVNRDVMSKIGEINSVGTLYAFDECDLDVKVRGMSPRKFDAVELLITGDPGDRVAFWAGDTPVYGSAGGTCSYSVPLPLSKLPGARPLRSPAQPLVSIGLIADQDCGLTQRIALAVAERVTTQPLPARDALAEYPSPLVDRDPCEVMSVAGADRLPVARQQTGEEIAGIDVALPCLGPPHLVGLAARQRERTGHQEGEQVPHGHSLSRMR